MYPLIETIKVVDGIPQHLKWHQIRLDSSFRKYYKADTIYQLSEIILIPEKYRSGLVKLRFSYSESAFRLQFARYEIKDIRTLKVIYDNTIDYSLKYSDRIKLEELFNRRGDCDDILVVKNGQVTDTYNCNITFFDGSKWLTPVSPLLKGTCRNRLIYEKKIIERKISIDQINSFVSFKLINAMRDLSEVNELPVSEIQT